jgi:chemotaxis protein CheD
VWPESRPKEVFLNPGEFAYGNERTWIRTILGSCVAVTFWHPQSRTGAMCHYLLPSRAPNHSGPPNGKFADDIIPLIADHFAHQGVSPEFMQVKMFGGGNMFPGLPTKENLTIGIKNIHKGLAVLTHCGFKIQSYDLAGGTNRSVIFDVGSGEVWVRQGQAQNNEPAMTANGKGTPA